MRRQEGYGRDRAPRYGRDYGPGRYGRDDPPDRGRRRARGYDPDFAFGGYPPGAGPYDATGWAPYAFTPFGWDPMLGWAGWGAGMGYVPPGGFREEPRPVPPRRSPMYGRGGDRALRRWAERYGYDFEYTIRPRPGGRGRHNREER